MKLRNKLIPIMTAATVAATIAPITSCTTTSAVVDLIKGYTPTIKKAVWEDYLATREDMLSFYASAVNENPEIFAQDLYWKYSIESFYEIDAKAYDEGVTVTPVTLEALANNIKVSKLTCFYDDEETQEKKEVNYYTISCDFQLHFVYDVDGQTAKQTIDRLSTISMKNIPITINRDGTSAVRSLDTFVPNAGENYSPLQKSFINGSLPTSWVIQPMLPRVKSMTPFGGNDTYEHTPFKHLTNNGYEWFFNATQAETITSTPYATKQPQTNVTTLEFKLNDLDQFTTAEEWTKAYVEDLDKTHLWDYVVVQNLSAWYIPSYYLSDIEDSIDQLWKLSV